MKVPSVALKTLVAVAIASACLQPVAYGSHKPEPLPTGLSITPTAAPGSTFLTLNPGLTNFPDFVAGQAVSTAASPDGKTLLILTSGYNRNNDSTGQTDPSSSNEYVFVYDISQDPPVQVQVVQVPNTFDGLAWNPNGNEFYVSGGSDDNVHVFDNVGGTWTESLSSPISLGHSQGLGIGGILPAAAGLAVSADGSLLLVANYENDSVSLIDMASAAKVVELDLRPGVIDPSQTGVPGGEYPFWVVFVGNQKAYVSSPRDREIVIVNVINPSSPSHKAPAAALSLQVTGRIKVDGQPTKLLLNRSQGLLFAALDNTDTVAVIDTSSDKITQEFSTIAPKWLFPDPQNFKGANPNSLVLSPDEKTLYVTNGGSNSVAVIHLATSASDISSVIGLIPTGWYPNSISLNAPGSRLYVVNGKSNAGPNPLGCRNTTSIAPGSLHACHAANEYVWQLTKAGFLIVPTPNKGVLKSLTLQVARNNNYDSGAETPANQKIMSVLHNNVQHVIYIVKENRTFDQVLGDLSNKSNGDPSPGDTGRGTQPESPPNRQPVCDPRQLLRQRRSQWRRLELDHGGENGGYP